MKMKKLSVALIAAGFMSSQVAMAGGDFATTDSQKGLSFAFENSAAMNYAPLSHTEMVETEGAVAPVIAFVLWAGAGVASYIFTTDEPTVQGAVVAGTIGGVTGGVGAVARPIIAAGYGIGTGVMVDQVWDDATLPEYIAPEQQNGNNTDFGFQPPGNAGYGPNR